MDHVDRRTGNTDDILNELRAYNAEIGVVGSMDPGNEFDTVGDFDNVVGRTE